MSTINRHIQFSRGEVNDYRIASTLPHSGEPIVHPFNKSRFHEFENKQVFDSDMICRIGTGGKTALNLSYNITNQLLQVYKLKFSNLTITNTWSDHSLSNGNVKVFSENGRWITLTSNAINLWNTYSINTNIAHDYTGADIYDYAHINPIVISADFPNQDLSIVGFLSNDRELQLKIKGETSRSASDVYVNVFIYQPFIEVNLPQPVSTPSITFIGSPYYIGFGESSLGQLGLETYGEQYHEPRPLFYRNSQNTAIEIIAAVGNVNPAIGKNHTILPTFTDALLLGGHAPSAFYRSGSSKYGQIGILPDGNKTNKFIPFTLSQNHYIERTSSTSYQISASTSNGAITQLVSNNKSTAFIALRTDPIVAGNIESLYTFGENSYGQLGLNDTIDRDAPTLVPTFFDPSDNTTLGSGISQTSYLNTSHVAIGHMHGLLIGDGKLYSWGNNVYGQCGVNKNEYYSVSEPRLVSSGIDGGGVDDVFSGSFHSFYTADSKKILFAFGKNDYGQLGLRHNNNVDNPEAIILTEPNAVELPPFPENITIQFTSTQTDSGIVEQIGFNQSTSRKYLLGREDGSRLEQKYRFVDIAEGYALAFIGIDQSKVTGQFIKTCREINGVNYNFYYGDYIEIEADIRAPITIVTCDEEKNIGGYEILAPYFDDNYEFLDIQAGLNHTVVLVKDTQLNKNIVLTCGDNTYGQLATGDNINRNYFYKIPGNWISIAAGDNHTVLVSEDYATYVAGDNSYGQLGLPSIIRSSNTLEIINVDFATAGISKAYAGSNSTILLTNAII
jgi:alpha-tubulin suppressor-like RCC1 family protein